jgi:hypothetical protein
MTTKNFINDWGVTPNVYSEAKSFENDIKNLRGILTNTPEID